MVSTPITHATNQPTNHNQYASDPACSRDHAMLIGYGFPRVLCAGGNRSADDEDWIYLAHDLNYIVAVSASTVQVWSAGLHRVRLSQVVRTPEEIGEDGINLCAFWCATKATLAVLVSALLRSIRKGSNLLMDINGNFRPFESLPCIPSWWPASMRLSCSTYLPYLLP